MINYKRIIICTTAFIAIVFSILFSFSNGLVDTSGEYYVKELLSGGSDDNICIEFSKLLFIPFCIYALKLKNKISLLEFLLGNVILIIQFVLLLSIESGSILMTLQSGNATLFLWLICYISLFIELNSFYLYERISNNKA